MAATSGGAENSWYFMNGVRGVPIRDGRAWFLGEFIVELTVAELT